MPTIKDYERHCLDRPNALQRWFIALLRRRAEALGQTSHKIWSLKYALDNFLPGARGLRVLDLGAGSGWLLSYTSPVLAARIALDLDPTYAPQMLADGIAFVQADLEAVHFPFAPASLDLVTCASTLEHLARTEHVAAEIARVLRPGGVVFVTVPDVRKYKFRFWDDVTHKRPFSPVSLRYLFESTGFETLALHPYNHDLFIAGNLFPPPIHRFLTRFCGKALLYAGRKKTA